MQFNFTLSLLKSAKAYGIRTAVETSGYTNKNLKELNPYVDLWLYDIKVFNEDDHIKYTGVSNKVIFENLYLLDSLGAKIILRCPIIPEVNMTAVHFNNIAKLSNKIKNLEAIHLEPYNPLGISKAKQLDKIQAYRNDRFLEVSHLMHFSDMLNAKTKIKIDV